MRALLYSRVVSRGFLACPPSLRLFAEKGTEEAEIRVPPWCCRNFALHPSNMLSRLVFVSGMHQNMFGDDNNCSRLSSRRRWRLYELKGKVKAAHWMRHANANWQYNYKPLGKESKLIAIRYISEVVIFIYIYLFPHLIWIRRLKLNKTTLANVSGALLNVTLLTASSGPSFYSSWDFVWGNITNCVAFTS